MTHRTIKRALETVGTVALVVTVAVIICAVAEVTPTPMDLRTINAWWRETLGMRR